MKKHNEGYALPFVLVVFLVITLVATSVLTVSLRNLQSQKASVARMEEKYVAAGAIEIVVAQMLDENNLEAIQGVQPGDVISEKIDDFCGAVYELDSSKSIWRDVAEEVHYEPGVDKAFTCVFGLVSQCGDTQIKAVLVLTGTMDDSEQSGGTVLYTVKDPVITYESYTIEGGVTE